MKRWIAFAMILGLGLGALVWSERHPSEVRVTPAALLYFIADSERELSRLPVAATRLSDAEEIAIGNRMALNNTFLLTSRAERTPDEEQRIRAVNGYVNRVGERVAARAHRRLPYKFHYVPNMNMVNAFALPGGHVYIGAGMVALMDSEDQLAAVLGHEVEHIDHYHCAERVQTEERLRRLPLGELALFPVTIFEAGYSKDQELEADREGTQLAVWAGYSPLGALRMFETFERLYREYVRRDQSPEDELSRVAIETVEGYFRSHPLPEERIEQIRKLIADNHWGGMNHERDLAVAYVFWTERAWQAYLAGHYEIALRQAQHSLELRGDQPAAMRLVGQAEFVQAHFAEASAAFQKALERAPASDELLGAYVEALEAQHTPAASLRTFDVWADAHPAINGRLEVRLALARLTLAARGQQAADAVLFPAVAADAASLPARLRGRYGWWLYRAGLYDAAAPMLQSAVQQMPSDPVLQTHLAWVLVEQHNLEAAIQRLQSAAGGYYLGGDGAPNERRRIFDERRIGLAVAEWQAQQFDRARSEFAGAANAQPEWMNQKWVSALYSPGVAGTIEELKADRKKPSRQRQSANF